MRTEFSFVHCGLLPLIAGMLALSGSICSAVEIAPIRLDDSFPADGRNDFQQVADDVWQLVRRRMPAEPPAGERTVRVIYRPDGPPLCAAENLEKEYRIYLNSGDRRYAQFAYQLSHELGHVMLDPRRTHAMAETLAEALSLQILADLHVHWKTDPPYANWKPYASHFATYAENACGTRLKAFPAEVAKAVREKRWKQVTLYLRYRREEQDRLITQRDLNGLAAMALMSGQVDWPKVVSLAGKTIPSADEEPRFRQDLTLPDAVLPSMMQRLGRGAESKLLAIEYTGPMPELPFAAINRFDFALPQHRVLLVEADAFDADAVAALSKSRGVLRVERVPK